METINGRHADLEEEAAFDKINHKFCQSADSLLLYGHQISALEFLNTWDAIEATDNLAIGGKHTLEEIVGEDNWKQWSDHNRFNAEFIVAELIKRRLVNLAVSSAHHEDSTRYELNYTGTGY